MFAMVFDKAPNIAQLDPGLAFQIWCKQVAIVAAVALFLAFVYSSSIHQNAWTGLVCTLRGLWEGLRDLALLPLGYRRIWAVTLLSIKEAVRRRILYVFVLFLVPFLFAGWYLPNTEEGQTQFLVAFVNSAITWLLLPLVVFLVSMTLPNDMKHKTIQTVVTKPIRRTELVVGRVLGFVTIFTAVLLVMGGVSLLYLWSNVSEQVRADQWTARVPIYATPPAEGWRPLMFRKKGTWQIEGTNVGKEYAYRSHIEGATRDQAHWFFRFDPAQFANRDNVCVELTFDIFKTTKGDPTRTVGDDAEKSGVWCQLVFQDEQTKRELYEETFRVNNNRMNVLDRIPSEVFQTGQLRVIASCLTRSQFLGMAPADLYILANEKNFSFNFVKGLVSIWLKVILLTCVAVAASTVLNGFVTILFTATIYILGFYYTFLVGVISGEVVGGGPIESLIRLVTQNNQQSPLDPGTFTDLALALDRGVLQLMRTVTHVIPNLETLDTVSFVASGFDIPATLVFRNCLFLLGYVVPVMVAGYFFLKNREIATT